MYASIHRRIFAFLIDILTIYIFPIILRFLGAIDNKISTMMLLAVFISWFYFFILLLIFKGKTLGSSLLGIQVVASDSTKLTIKSIIIRSILLTILIAPVGVVLIASIINLIASLITLNTPPWKEKKQTVWDFASDTCVINTKSNNATI